ncbi:MAG: alkaline phosphatase family protein [Saprospiraceae bacterium]|nr:alkaline phosphatase family protein [Saprospiraceae bacterium]MDW8484717.1 alkaline phosphatase D family protein [Saprospiraceae bacterium]
MRLCVFQIFLFCLLGLFGGKASYVFAQEYSDNVTERSVDLEAFQPRPIDLSKDLSIISFGSCNDLNLPQDMWASVVANKPDLWIWLGDIIYADTTNPRVLAAHYKRLKTHPAYKKLRDQTPIIGIYDDHDYGANDAGKGLPNKRATKKCLLDFLDVPYSDPVRKREGAYQAYLFGTPPRQIKIIVLDTRYFRDTLLPDPDPARRYLPNLEGDILGEAQWAWLEKELTHSPAQLHILVSSIQVLANEHGYEKWGNFPNARKRLFQLLVKTKPANLLILSGDRHMAEISRLDLQGLPYPLYDFTSSGMTHIRTSLEEANRLRVGPMIVKRNFGILKIRWEGTRPVVQMEVRGLQNELLLEHTVQY